MYVYIYIYPHLTKIEFVLHLSEVQTHALKLRTQRTPTAELTEVLKISSEYVCHFLKRTSKLRIPYQTDGYENVVFKPYSTDIGRPLFYTMNITCFSENL